MPDTELSDLTEEVSPPDTYWVYMVDSAGSIDRKVSRKNVVKNIVDGDISVTAAIALSKLATDPLARANHTGTQLASTISDFDTQVRLSRLDQMAIPTSDLNINTNKLTGVVDPTNPQDAATKSYVDIIEQGLDIKDSVRVATTANITLSGEQTIDGVLTSTDRILVKDQSSGSENGIYVTAAGAWSRATDADTSAKVTSGMFTFVEEGTTNADAGLVLTTNDPITLDTTALIFTQFSGAGQITAGAGLTKSGNTIDIVGTANRILVNADSIDIHGSYVGQASIITLGTVVTGVWNATAITYANLSFSDDIVDADISSSAAIALSKLATDPLARANHTGTQTISTLSDLDTGTVIFSNKTINDFTNDNHADDIHKEVRNESGGELVKGDIIYVSGFSVGQTKTLVTKADASSSATMPAIGMVNETIANNNDGEIIEAGEVSGIDTSAFSVGDIIYVSITAGGFSTRPTGATDIVQAIGAVLRSHATLGVVEIIDSGHEDELPNLVDDKFWLGNASNAPIAVAMSGDVTMTNAGATIIGAGKIDDAMLNITDDAMLVGIEFIIDGGESVITTGVKGFLEIPFNCTIERVTLLADQTGSIVIDIWKDIYANYPPTVADTITAEAKPTISAGIKDQDATLTGWTKTVSEGDIIGFNVDSITTCERVTISLKVRKT